MAVNRVIARLTVECTSPLAIGTGDDDPLYDLMLARDPNGLPMLPATSIAGALRARLTVEDARKWLGSEASDTPARSLVDITDGLVHWSDNKPRDGRVDHDSMTGEFCQMLLGKVPVERDHVRLDHRGVVDGDGKFTRSAVPTGTRFTFELRSTDDRPMAALVALVKAGLVLGGASRAGYGQLRCICCGEKSFDLSTDKDWSDYCKMAVNGIGQDSLIDCKPVEPHSDNFTGWQITGQIEGPLLVAMQGGDPSRPKRVPYQEARISWQGDAATLGRHVVIPGSGIKGPIRHRTEFHLRKSAPAQAEVLIVALFGNAASGDDGMAGALRFHDCIPEDARLLKDVSHVSLDRFSGGARKGALFADDMLWRPMLTLKIERLRPLPDAAVKALMSALGDLANGLCGIGAEWGEGAGVFEGADVVEAGGK